MSRPSMLIWRQSPWPRDHGMVIPVRNSACLSTETDSPWGSWRTTAGATGGPVHRGGAAVRHAATAGCGCGMAGLPRAAEPGRSVGRTLVAGRRVGCGAAVVAVTGAGGPVPPGEAFGDGFPLAGPVTVAGCADCAAPVGTIRASTVERDLGAATDGRVPRWRHLDQARPRAEGRQGRMRAGPGGSARGGRPHRGGDS